jgi:hypothetical protein
MSCTGNTSWAGYLYVNTKIGGGQVKDALSRAVLQAPTANVMESSMTTSGVVSVTAGQSYEFGCWLDWVTNSDNCLMECHATYVCQ